MYERLQRVNVTMSHKSCVRLVTKLGQGFDCKLTEWRDNAITQLKILHQVRFLLLNYCNFTVCC